MWRAAADPMNAPEPPAPPGKGHRAVNEAEVDKFLRSDGLR
jgi:hypothetical protein